MSETPPTPPGELHPALLEELTACSPEQLRALSEYAEQLADYRAASTAPDDDPDTEHKDEDLPTGVPSKATVTVKEINDNRYYYWQWREGDTIKSKYKGPVDATV